MDVSFLSPEAINNFFHSNPIISIAIGVSAVIATLAYVLSFSEVIRREMKRRRMKRTIDRLKDHFILCGFGRVGQQIAHELADEGQPFVIIERDATKLKLAQEHGWPFIEGDVALDESLFEKAKLATAKSVIISVGTDADAIFMAVSARALKSDIFIVARASSLEAADKLNKVGVNRVTLPYQIGGYHMAQMALRPTVVDFLDILVDNEHQELEMEEYLIAETNPLCGKTIGESGLRSGGLVLVAIRRASGKALINPRDSVAIEPCDRIVMMGSGDKLAALRKEVDKHAPKEAKTPAQKSTVVSDIKPSPFVKNKGDA